METIPLNTSEFVISSDKGLTFETWCACFVEFIRIDGARLVDPANVRLLMSKIYTSTHEKHTNLIFLNYIPLHKFQDTVKKLKVVFGCQSYLFSDGIQKNTKMKTY